MQMAAMGEVHPEYRIAWLQDGQINRYIGFTAGVRVYVDVFCAKQFFGAFDRPILDDVDALAPPIISTSRITLGVFVGKNRTRRLQYAFVSKVLGCNQFKSVGLAAGFILNRGVNLRIEIF